MKASHAAQTHPGYHRRNNEDAWLADPSAQLYVVCDGMGGHEDGEIASRIAVDTLAERLGGSRGLGLDQAREALRRAVLEAHRRISLESVRRELEVPMGTTLVAALLLEDVAVVAATGDSRAYLVGRSGARQITRDHTVAERYAEMGLIAPDEVRRHPLRNMLVRALGSPIDAQPDLYVVAMGRGDRLLLCSDGLSDRLADQTIVDAARSDQPTTDAAAELVRLALEGGGFDNITVVLIEREDGAESPAYAEEDSGDSLPAAPRALSEPAQWAASSSGDDDL